MRRGVGADRVSAHDNGGDGGKRHPGQKAVAAECHARRCSRVVFAAIDPESIKFTALN